MRVYKYRGGDDEIFERDLSSLEQNSIYAPCANDLNDPCETLVFTDNLKKQSYIFSKLFGERYKDGIAEVHSLLDNVINRRNEIGIYSLSQTPLNELLWAHYSFNHKGFCIEYQSEILTNENSFSKFYSFPIKYSKNPPQIELSDVNSSDIHKILKKISGNKSISWKYEEEIRITTDKFGVHYYDFKALKSIYFGLRISESHKSEIMRRLKGRGINYYQILLDEKSYQFYASEVKDEFEGCQEYMFKIYRGFNSDTPTVIDYEIIEQKYDSVNNKGILTIKLSEKISLDELTILGNELKEKLYKNSERLYIYYLIPSLFEKRGAWAITHYTSDGNQIEIMGLSLDEEKYFHEIIMKKDCRNVIGKWLDESPYLSSILTLYKEDNKYFLETIFKDGSSSIEEKSASVLNVGIRYDDIGGNQFGEYFVVDNDVFSYYSEDGLFNRLEKNYLQQKLNFMGGD